MCIILVLKCYICYEVGRFEDCNIILECLLSEYVRKYLECYIYLIKII